MKRQADIHRETRETDIRVRLGLDGEGAWDGATGLPFMDHMLTAWTRYGRFDLHLQARGDLEVDAHHTLEDVGLVLGRAFREAVGGREGIARFGTALVPMDEALVRVVVDLSGRPHLSYRLTPPAEEVGGFHSRLVREFLQAFVNTAGITLHVDLLAGEEVHHVFEAMFKALGRALGQAVSLDPRCTGVPSTKGVLD